MNLIVSVREVQKNHLIFILIRVQIEYFNIMIIAVLLTFSESLDSEKKNS